VVLVTFVPLIVAQTVVPDVDLVKDVVVHAAIFLPLSNVAQSCNSTKCIIYPISTNVNIPRHAMFSTLVNAKITLVATPDAVPMHVVPTTVVDATLATVVWVDAIPVTVAWVDATPVVVLVVVFPMAVFLWVWLVVDSMDAPPMAVVDVVTMVAATMV